MSYCVAACRNRNWGPYAPAFLFSDGFESGDFTAWDSTVIDGGDLAATEAAALVGSYGMAAVLDDNTAIYVRDNTPASETRYRCRFYFDPNSISMGALDAHWILDVKNASNATCFGLILRYNSGYEIRMGIQNDTPAFQYTAYSAVTDAPHYIEVDWKASSAAGANNGTAEWWLDGVSQGSLSSLDNDTYVVDYVMWGAVVGIDTNTRGTYYFDAFASNNTGAEIGA